MSRKPDFYGIWVNSVNCVIEPHTVKEALSSSKKENWQEAMQDEFKSPEGFIEQGKENLVCRLNRSIYGLKQAP